MWSVSFPKYVWSLFESFLDEMKIMAQKGTLWINREELDKPEYLYIERGLFGDGKLFDLMNIDKWSIPLVQQYKWEIAGDVKYWEQIRSMIDGVHLGPIIPQNVPIFEYMQVLVQR